MSNTVTAGGLRLYKSAGFAEALEVVVFAAADGARVGIGDPVLITNAGSVAIGQGPLAPTVTLAGASGIIDYVIVGMLPQFSDGNGNMDLTKCYRPASTAMYALARAANNKDIYEITDDASATITAANVGYNANLVVASCSTANGLSNFMLNAATVATTNTFQVKIVGVVDDVRNDATSTSARWLVTLNEVRRANQIAGV